MRRESRILGIDDGPFSKFGGSHRTLIVGALFRGGIFLDGILSTYAEVDGSDSTEKIIGMIKGSRFFPQIRIIMFKGVSVAGFNVLDIRKINFETGIPVVIFMRKMPDFDGIRKALSNLPDGMKKWDMIKRAGRIHKISIDHRNSLKEALIQVRGMSIKEAAEAVKMSCTHSAVPEPLRIAHMIASGIVKGESKGKA